MEGGMIAHALRLREGLPIYAPPSLDFVPFFYTPGYPSLLYALDVLGLPISLGSARAVSLIATLLTMFVLGMVIKRETKLWSFALLGVGLYAALFRTSGAFYDLARPDALMLFFLICAIAISHRAKSIQHILIASTLISAAFFTKQTAAVYFPVIAAWVTWHHRGRGVLFVTMTLGLCSLGVWWMDECTGGSFWTYIFEGHQGHVFYWKNILLKYWRDLIFLAPITLLLPLLWFSRFSPTPILPLLLALHWSAAFIQRAYTLDYPPHMYYRELFYESPRWLIIIPPLLMIVAIFKTGQWGRPFTAYEKPQSAYWLWMYIAGAGASGLNHSTQWAYSNCFMLLGLSLSITAPMMIKDLMSVEDELSEVKTCLTAEEESDPPHESFAWLRMRSPLWIWFILGVQLIAWFYWPSQQVPHKGDYQAWGALTERLERYEAPLFFPGHPSYNALERGMQGRAAIHTHQMGIRDVAYRGGVADLKQRLSRGRSSRRHIKEEAEAWSAVVTHESTQIPYLEQFYYEANRWRYLKHDSLRAKTGFLTRPESLWLPRNLEIKARTLKVGEVSVNLNFENHSNGVKADLNSLKKEPSALWNELGWRSQGLAFGEGPICRTTWMGEGRCGASSHHKERGQLESTIELSSDAHLSLLVKGETPRSHALNAQLSLRLINASGQSSAHMRVRADGKWRRVLLIPKNRTELSETKKERFILQLIDQDQRAVIMVDDIKIDVALDR